MIPGAVSEWKKGDTVAYIKPGQAPYWDTKWPAVYIRRTAKGRHTIRVIGQRRLKTVKTFSLVSAKQ